MNSDEEYMIYLVCDDCLYLTADEPDADDHVESTDHTMTYWCEDFTHTRVAEQLLLGQEP